MAIECQRQNSIN